MSLLTTIEFRTYEKSTPWWTVRHYTSNLRPSSWHLLPPRGRVAWDNLTGGTNWRHPVERSVLRHQVGHTLEREAVWAGEEVHQGQKRPEAEVGFTASAGNTATRGRFLHSMDSEQINAHYTAPLRPTPPPTPPKPILVANDNQTLAVIISRKFWDIVNC